MAGEPLSDLPAPRPLPRGHRPRRPPALRRPADPRRPRHALVLGQGGGDALQPLPRRRHPARPRDALDRRGHGLGPHLPPRLPQGPDGRRHRPPHHRHPLRLGQGRRQDRPPPRGHPHPARPRLPHPRHRRHRSASSPPHAIPATRVNKVYEGRPHIVDTLKDGGVQIVFNTTEGTQSIADSRAIRSLTLSGRIPYYTTAAGARAAALAMRDRLEGDLRVRSLQG